MSEQPKISDEAVELAAKLLYERHHKYFGTFNEWTMRHWDAGPQHVNRQPWLDDASALLAAAYPLLRQQWEAEMSECDERIALHAFSDGSAQTVPCVRKPLGHPMPHRSADGMEWRPVDRQASGD